MKPKTKLQAQSRLLRSQGLSLKQIASKLRVSKGSVSAWTKEIVLTPQQKAALKQRELFGAQKGHQTNARNWQEKKAANPPQIKGPRWPAKSVEHFFDYWSKDMAWVLGYFVADGSMYISKTGGHYIDFTSIDIELIQLVKSLMSTNNKIGSYLPKKGKNQIRYHLQIGSKKLFQKLIELGITPRKSLTILCPKIPDQFFWHFLRGYFDGDGHAEFRQVIRANRNNHVYNILSMKLTSGSLSLLQALKANISYLTNIQGGSLITRSIEQKTWHVLAYSTHDVIKLFGFMYPNIKVPCLLRKRHILERGITVIGVEV